MTLYCLVGSRSLPVTPVIGQPRGAALLRGTVATCLHVLQAMMTSSARTSGRRFGNA
jgi:hypothetical protein